MKTNAACFLSCVQSKLILKTRLEIRGRLYGAALGGHQEQRGDWRKSKENMKIVKCIIYVFGNIIIKPISLCTQHTIIKERILELKQ